MKNLYLKKNFSEVWFFKDTIITIHFWRENSNILSHFWMMGGERGVLDRIVVCGSRGGFFTPSPISYFPSQLNRVHSFKSGAWQKAQARARHATSQNSPKRIDSQITSFLRLWSCKSVDRMTCALKIVHINT